MFIKAPNLSLCRKVAANAQIAETNKKQLIMKELEHIFYDFVGNVVFDASGKIYPIKGSDRWWYINLGKSKVSVSKLKQRFLIRNFDDFITRYAIYFNAHFPCKAMAYYVYRKETGSKITLIEFFKR